MQSFTMRCKQHQVSLLNFEYKCFKLFKGDEHGLITGSNTLCWFQTSLPLTAL